MPYPVIQHSYASPSTVAWVIHQKYELAVPLYRQDKEGADPGVTLSRATMSNWILASYRDWPSPVVGLLKEKLLEQNYLHIDVNACSGTFRTGQKKYDRLLHVGVLFYKKQQSSNLDV